MTHASHYVGLDVSLKKTAICICDGAGEIVLERKVASDPDAIAAALRERNLTYERVGLEAGSTAQWIHEGLTRAGFAVVCIEARHAHAFISCQINKNDRNDARGIATMMRCGVFKPVHMKSPQSQRWRVLLGSRKMLQGQLLALDSHIRGELATFGLQLGAGNRGEFEGRVWEFIRGDPQLRDTLEPVLTSRSMLHHQFEILHEQVLRAVRGEPVCIRLMTAPGVGPVTALTFRSVIDEPDRFQSSKDVAAYLGLTPRQHQSGEIDRMGGISELGSQEARTALFEAGLKLVTSVRQPSALRDWAQALAEAKGPKTAAAAAARRLAAVLHRIWVDGSEFEPWPSKGAPKDQRAVQGAPA